MRLNTVKKAQSYIHKLKQAFKCGDGHAGFALAIIYSEGNTLISEKIKKIIGASDLKASEYNFKSFILLKKTARTGDGESMHLIAQYYQCGLPPVKRNRYLFELWTQKAFAAGYLGAFDNLMQIYQNPKSKLCDTLEARRLWNRFNNMIL